MNSATSYTRYVNAITLNGTQLLHMCIAAIAVPAIIGVEQYGKYASLFAIPGAVSGFIETIFILSAGLTRLNIRDTKKIASLILAVSCIAIVLCYATFGFEYACCSLAIIAIFSFRSLWMSRVLGKHGNNLFRPLLISDTLTTLGYVLAIALSASTDFLDYRMPILMVLIGGTLSGTSYMLFFRRLDSQKSDKPEIIQLKLGHIIGRTYEELFYTLFPLILNHLKSSHEAGLYRITISVFKGISKIFPYRYETFATQSSVGSFASRVFIRDAMIFTLLWSLICLGLLIGGKTWDVPYTSTNMLMLSASAGPSVCLAVTLPTYGIRHQSLHILTFIAFTIMLLFAATPFFAFAFTIIHFFAWTALLTYIQRTDNNNTTESINV